MQVSCGFKKEKCILTNIYIFLNNRFPSSEIVYLKLKYKIPNIKGVMKFLKIIGDSLNSCNIQF